MSFYNSYNVVTASAIVHDYPLRPLSEKEIADFTPNGELLIVNLVAKTGPLMVRNMLRYVDGKAHMVLTLDGKNYQPVAMVPVTSAQIKDASVTSIESSSNYWGRWLGWTSSSYVVQNLPTEISLGFSFDIPIADRNKMATIVLIDSEGSRYQQDFELSKAWK